MLGKCIPVLLLLLFEVEELFAACPLPMTAWPPQMSVGGGEMERAPQTDAAVVGEMQLLLSVGLVGHIGVCRNNGLKPGYLTFPIDGCAGGGG